jgi:hypothetical protein
MDEKEPGKYKEGDHVKMTTFQWKGAGSAVTAFYRYITDSPQFPCIDLSIPESSLEESQFC